MNCKLCGAPIPGRICVNPQCGLLQPKIGPKTYEEFMKAVDHELSLLAGVTSDVMDDYNYQKAWRSNRAAKAVAKAAIRAAGGDDIPF